MKILSGNKIIKTAALAAMSLMLITSLSACSLSGSVSSMKQGGIVSSSTDKAGKDEESQLVSLDIMCVGDIMAHSTNYKGAYDAATGTYDFNDNYDYVRDIISGADVALCNIETTFGGGAPSGYPMFCAPDSLATAVASAGFDIAMTSNNHMMDTGFDGMQRTLQILREAGLKTVGSRYDGEKTYLVYDAPNDVKVGVVAYTYETSGAGSSAVTINGNHVSDQSAALINSFNYNELDSVDYGRMQADIDGARADGADIVICYMHWGEEYQREPNGYEVAMAQRLADMGADIIFASHPHLPQKIDVVTAADDGQQVPVFYSMGNFISNQRVETLTGIGNSKYTEQELIAEVRVVLDKSTGELVSENVSAIPLWVDRFDNGGKKGYRIIPLTGDLSSNYTLSTTGHLQKAIDALQDIRLLIGDDYINGEIEGIMHSGVDISEMYRAVTADAGAAEEGGEAQADGQNAA